MLNVGDTIPVVVNGMYKNSIHTVTITAIEKIDHRVRAKRNRVCMRDPYFVFKIKDDTHIIHNLSQMKELTSDDLQYGIPQEFSYLFHKDEYYFELTTVQVFMG